MAHVSSCQRDVHDYFKGRAESPTVILARLRGWREFEPDGVVSSTYNFVGATSDLFYFPRVLDTTPFSDMRAPARIIRNPEELHLHTYQSLPRRDAAERHSPVDWPQVLVTMRNDPSDAVCV